MIDSWRIHVADLETLYFLHHLILGTDKVVGLTCFSPLSNNCRSIRIRFYWTWKWIARWYCCLNYKCSPHFWCRNLTESSRWRNWRNNYKWWRFSENISVYCALCYRKPWAVVLEYVFNPYKSTSTDTKSTNSHKLLRYRQCLRLSLRPYDIDHINILT